MHGAGPMTGRRGGSGDGAAGEAGEAGAAAAEERGSDFAHLFVFANEKAGMKRVDKEHVNQVVFEMSKGSEHFKEAQRRDERTQAEVRKLRAKLAATLESDLAPVRHRVDAKVSKLLRERELALDRIYCVVDMDCFFAAVEMRDDPSLAGKPMAVGGLSMISTTNYLAREYGVRSAMPGFIARKLCPELVFVKTNFDKYRKASQDVRDVLQKYDPDLRAASLDEAYMDITAFVDARMADASGATTKSQSGDDRIAARFRVAESVVQEMRAEVSTRTRLTCSAGIARTSMLAKIASDRNKPNGQCVVPCDLAGMLAFARALPIRKVPGIGKVTEKKLKDALEVATVQDLWEKRYLCGHLLSATQADHLLRVTLCCTNRTASTSSSSSSSPAVVSSSSTGATSAFGEIEDAKRGRKSIGMERTFSRGTGTAQELFDTCQDICARLSARCMEKRLVGHCVTLKIKSTSFEVFTRQTMLTNAVPRSADGSDLFGHARELLAKEMPCRLRLMGVKISKLVDASRAPAAAPSAKAAQGSITAIFSDVQRRRLQEQQQQQQQQTLVEGKKEEDSHLSDHTSNARAESECPVCGKGLRALHTLDAHLHVDACLSGGNAEPTNARKKRVRPREGLHSFFAPSSATHGKKRAAENDATVSLPDETKRLPSERVGTGSSPDGKGRLPSGSSCTLIEIDDDDSDDDDVDDRIVADEESHGVEEAQIVEEAAQLKCTSSPDCPRCPACGLRMAGASNAELNQHLDRCLAT